MSDDNLPHDGSGRLPATLEADPLPDPGLPEHQWRPTDVDLAAEKRAERQVAGLFGLAAVFAVLFCVAYFALPIGEDIVTFLGMGASNLALGVSLGMSLMLIGIGAIQWARKLMTDHEMVEMRHPSRSPDEDRQATLTALGEGIEESGIKRRPLIRNSLLGALGALGLPAIVVLRDLGPLPGDVLERTVWKDGMRLVNDISGEPIRPEDLEVGQLINGQPGILFEKNEEGEPLYLGTDLLREKAKSAIVVVRMDPQDITPAKGREDWGVDGILCYSKICTHVGCPISLWEQQTHNLLCPCHQSTFDLANNGKVVFGPAARAVPQLPIKVDSEGYLVAQSDFTEAVGPSFWERG